MVGLRHHFVWARAGVSVILVGFLSVLVSFFLLPIYITTLNCFDSCSPPKHPTLWEFSLNEIAHFSVTTVTASLILLLCYLPLLGAVMVAVCSTGFLVSPRRALITWSQGGLQAGSVALVIVLAFLLLFVRPQVGYLGMLFGYGLLWGGERLILRASQPTGVS